MSASIRVRAAGLLLLLTSVGIATGSRAARADAFWDRWGDGKAELDGYRLTEPRYGAPRAGSAVLIFVTEDFSEQAHVKAERPELIRARGPGDTFPVLKLNSVRHFQTGIYDYKVMSSTFLRVDAPPGGAPLALVKTSFSSQEWCGHVYQQWNRRGDKLEGALHSYFDGEADASPTLPLPPGGVLEEQLPVLVRGLRGDFVARGQARTVPFLPSLLRARFEHKAPAWGQATVRRSATTAPRKTALGTLPAETWTVEESGGPTVRYFVEADGARRLLGWESSTGEAAELVGSTRLPYWELNQPGGERYVKELGLPLPLP